MRVRLLPIVLAMFILPQIARAQLDAEPADPSVILSSNEEPITTSRFWMDAEYLCWWIKDGPAPPPMVTTGTGTPANFGILGPGTTVLFGDVNFDYGCFSGMRVRGGVWLADRFGLEADAFLLGQRGINFEIVGKQGAPPLAIPFFNPATGREDRLPVASPAFAVAGLPPAPSTGSIVIRSLSRLWGAEGFGFFRVAESTDATLDLLLGSRYLDLSEAQRFAARIVINGENGNAVDATGREHFETDNRFYGVLLGSRLGLRRKNWAFTATSAVSIGATCEVVNIEGARVQFGSGLIPTVVNRGAVFTEPTNLGRMSRDGFAVVPETRLRAGYAVGPRMQILLGYDFLFWSSVVRPGNQIDRVINTSQRIGGTLIGPARPMPFFNPSSFWAHGLNAGVQLSY